VDHHDLSICVGGETFYGARSMTMDILDVLRKGKKNTQKGGRSIAYSPREGGIIGWGSQLGGKENKRPAKSGCGTEERSGFAHKTGAEGVTTG